MSAFVLLVSLFVAAMGALTIFASRSLTRSLRA
jgi:HAMP domain-containing protein